AKLLCVRTYLCISRALSSRKLPEKDRDRRWTLDPIHVPPINPLVPLGNNLVAEVEKTLSRQKYTPLATALQPGSLIPGALAIAGISDAGYNAQALNCLRLRRI